MLIELRIEKIELHEYVPKIYFSSLFFRTMCAKQEFKILSKSMLKVPSRLYILESGKKSF